jgi:histidyl-tRNA synthetase
MNITNTKPPKGTIDLYSNELHKITYYKTQLENMFIQNGGIGLETPVFELRENLMGKYGEEAETKLVFNLEDNGSEEAEKYTLRYDLTIPKMRFIQSRSIEVGRIYSIGKVYRRDNPSLGRFREFYQADFDIIGEDSSSLINEMVLLKIADQFIKANNLGPYKILINDTSNLKYLLVDIIKIDPNKFKSICSTIDKLDKMEFAQIVSELETKGLNSDQIDLLRINLSSSIPSYSITSDRINWLTRLANPFGFASNIVFTPYMARGLDYYNGMIWEIVLDNFKSTVISGGRYDGLIGKNTSLVGISFGLSRMIDLLPNLTPNIKWKNLYMCVCICNEINLETKLDIVARLEKKYNTNILLNSNLVDKKLVKSITWCVNNYIKYLFVLAPNELANNQIILKDLENSTQQLIDLN